MSQDSPENSIGGQPNEEPIRELDWREAVQALDNVQPGDILTGFRAGPSGLQDLDMFAHNVGNHLKGRPVDPDTLPKVVGVTQRSENVWFGWHKSSRRPSNAIVPKHALPQQVDNIRVVILDAQPKTVDEQQPAPQKRFVIHADIHKTGLGNIAHIAQQCTIRMCMSNPGGLVRSSDQTTAQYKKLPEDNADAAVEAALKESREIYRRVIARALRTVFHGGLPGLGNR